MGFSLLAALLLSAQPTVGPPAPAVGPPAPVVGPPAPVAPAPAPDAEAADGETPPDENEIVVTGERYDENSPYRVPMRFRNERSDEDRDASWGARTNDLEAVERFGNQTIGLNGPSQARQQRECQWRAERQEAQGRRPDCGARSRPNRADDWERR